MDFEGFADLQSTLVEISATAAVMQAGIRALMATHPDPCALRNTFLQEVEKHTARVLALAVPDMLCDRIEALALRALNDMPHAAGAASARSKGSMAIPMP